MERAYLIEGRSEQQRAVPPQSSDLPVELQRFDPLAGRGVIHLDLSHNGGIHEAVENHNVASADGKRSEQPRIGWVGDVDEVQSIRVTSNCCETVYRFDFHVHAVARQGELAQQSRLIETRDVHDGQPSGSERQVGGLPACDCHVGCQGNVPRAAVQRQGGDDARDRRPSVEWIQPLTQLGEVADVVAVAVRSAGRRANRALDVVGQAVKIRVGFGAGGEDHAAGERGPLTRGRGDSGLVPDQPRVRIEHR
jgi:hypothetical protein